MSLTKAVAGQSIQADQYFKPDGGGAYTFVGFVKYIVTDFNDVEIISGAAAQDQYDLARWSVQFTLPSSAPANKPGQKYKLKWIAKVLINGESETIRETIQFDVVPADDFARIDVTERIALEKSKFMDRLLLPANVELQTLSVKVLDINSEELYGDDDISVEPSGTDGINQWWIHSSPTTLEGLVLNGLNAAPIQIAWDYTLTDGTSDTVFHYLYLVNAATQRMMLQIRASIDKARNVPHNPALAWFDTDLLVYIDQGLQMFNSYPPTFTSYAMANLPPQLQYPVLQCVLYNALRAQLLVEGQAQFNFSGQSVQLDVDRQASIESELSRIQGYIDSSIKSVKRLNNRIGGAGVLGVNFGPQFNWQPPIYRNPYFLGSMGIPPGNIRW